MTGIETLNHPSRSATFAHPPRRTHLTSAMTERRFNDAEVAAIFERATKAQQADARQLIAGEGLSLAELQEIGREVGLAPDLIVQAALSVDTGGRATSRKFFGLPIGVGRTVELERKLSDDEWAQLVVDLRDTFDARGVMREQGSFRQWTNGNLQALLEPTATGQRLRLRTYRSEMRTLTAGALALVSAAVVALLAKLLRGDPVNASMLMSLGVITTLGASMIATGTLRVSGWAKLRQKQMEEVVARLAHTMQLKSHSDSPPR